MDKLKICTVNVAGLNDTAKRDKIYDILRYISPEIICLQETHIPWGNRAVLQINGYDLAVCSSQTSTIRGVAIFIKHKVGISKRTLADKWGRWAIVSLSTGLTIGTIYASNQDDPEIWKELEIELATWPTPLILCGDFNIHLGTSREIGLGYTGRKSKVNQAINMLKTSHGLEDVWAAKNDKDPGFTYFSSPHQKGVRLDYFMVSAQILGEAEITKMPQIFSDHNPLLLGITYQDREGKPRPWTFDRKLLADEEFLKFIKDWTREFFDANRYSTSRAMVWDAFKASLRGQVISFVGQQRKHRKDQITALMTKLSQLEIEHINLLGHGNFERLGEVRKEIAVAKAEINSLFQVQVAQAYQTYQRERYEYGEMTGRLLALRIRQRATFNNIAAIKNSDGQLQNTPIKITEVFEQFYSKLYQLDPGDSGQVRSMRKYLGSGRLDAETHFELEKEISLEETRIALNTLSSGKASGPDKIPVEIYKVLQLILVPILQDLFLDVQYRGIPPRSWQETDIVIFLKKGKPPELPGSYRPISLINSDAKIYSKVLANRLQGIIAKLVSPWQHGFIPGRGTTDHIRRVISLIDIAEVKGDGLAVILLDAEKAFDRVTWQYLWEILAERGFGPRLITAIQAMYYKPTARLQVMGNASDPISVARGTRQGCPCSPILFALYIDPFVNQLILNTAIEPYRVNGYETKVLAYADDIAVVTSRPGVAITEIESMAEEFGSRSGYRLNKGKTQVICSRQCVLQDQRQTDSAMYLGVRIGFNLDKLWTNNLDPILKDISEELRRIDKLHLTIVGRINVLKMKIFPRILYLFRSIPLILQPNIIQKMNAIFSNFIWNYHKIRRALRILTLPRERGGWAAPNILFYYWAAFLQQMGTLLVEERMDREDDLPSIYQLAIGKEAKGLFLRQWEPSYYKNIRFKCIKAARSVWIKASKILKVPKLNRYTPLWGSSLFPAEIMDGMAKDWERAGIIRASCLYNDEAQIIPFSDLVEEFGIDKGTLFKYIQMKGCLKSLERGSFSLGEIPILEKMHRGARIGDFYNILLETVPDDLDKMEARWVEKLGDAEVDLDMSLELGRNILLAANLKTQHYKTVFDLYYTPAKLYKWGKRESDKCPRCRQGPADIVHMFFSCNSLSSLKKGIENFWQETTNRMITITPSMMLVGYDSRAELSTIHRDFVFITTTIARLLIASVWKDTEPPSYTAWLYRVLNIHVQETALYNNKGWRAREKGRRVWGPMTNWFKEGSIEPVDRTGIG